MKDTREVDESPEKQIDKTPEKKIDTFNDVRASDKSDRVDTFDDIKNSGSDISVKTFDDIRSPKETDGKQTKIEATEKTAIDTHESLEQKRMDQSVEDIKKNEWMKPEKWKTLNNDEKRIALEHSGKVLRDAYNSPDPPLVTKKMEDPCQLGEYGDGYTYDPKKDQYNGHIEVNPRDYKGHGIVGSDYGIRMNREGIDYEKNEKLFGNDPKVALETYAHEFRHSYQNEQVHAFDKRFMGLVDNPEKAQEWSENLKDYKQPPDAELAKTEPERFYKEYEAYRNQPVEKDAREFGQKISSEVYRATYKEK